MVAAAYTAVDRAETRTRIVERDQWGRSRRVGGGSEADWKIEPTVVKKRASIGSGATVLSKVTIGGKNAIVGAGAVVTRDVPPNSIVAGNPARVLRKRKQD